MRLRSRSGRRPPGPRGDPLTDLADGARELRVGRGRWSVSERGLLVAGGVLVPVGVAVILLGWFGAARTSNVFEQIPYLISGGMLGLALVFLGGFLYFAHWLTQLVQEQRTGSAAVVRAMDRLADALERRDPPPAAPAPRAAAPPDAPALVATAGGTLAHRPTCRVVAGKPGLRAVGADEGLAPCRLCNPPMSGSA